MASFADALELIKQTALFDIVVPFILVYGFVYGVLSSVKVIESKELQAIISVGAALAVSISTPARSFVLALVPFLIGFSLVLFLLIFLLLAGGFQMEFIRSKILQPEQGGLWLIIVGIGLVLVFIVLTSAFPDINAPDLEQKAIDENKTLAEIIQELPAPERTMFFLSTPQVLGVIVLLVIFAVAGFLIADNASR